MIVDISIFGFAEDRPALFQGKNSVQMTLEQPATVEAVMRNAGFTDSSGLALMINNRVVPGQDWGTVIMKDGDNLTVLSALEGG